jgi:hypothetical protein
VIIYASFACSFSIFFWKIKYLAVVSFLLSQQIGEDGGKIGDDGVQIGKNRGQNGGHQP